MSTLGKGVKSIRKKDLQTQKSFGTGVKKLVFYHQATAGDTGINLFSLVMPSSIAAIGKSNPTTSAIAGARLFFFQDNFQLFSSLHGWLMPSSFVVASSGQINLVGFTAADQEIFIGYLDNIIQPSLHAADVNPINATGTLAVGTTDFAVTPFTANLYPLTQMGSVLVFRNGIIQMRNTNNATASLTADGNYQEVPSSGGLSSTIRFNVPAPGPSTDSIVVVSNGALIEQPTDSQMAYIETLAGQINSMIPVLSDAAGVPTSTFGSNPSSVDLRVYGDQTIKNTNAITAIQPYVGENLSALRQYNLTVTGTNWTTTRAKGVPYFTLDGTWRLRFNINGTFAGAANSNQNNPLLITGVTYPAIHQAISALWNNIQGAGIAGITATVYTDGSIYAFWGNSVNYNSVWAWSGDVELAAKPSFVP